MQFLRASAAAYDAGNKWEAVRLAAVVFILVHDGGQRCILTQLGARGALRFPAMQEIKPGNLLSDMPLVMLRSGPDGLSYEPHLGDKPTGYRLLQFHKWWEKDAIYRDQKNRSLTRRRLVFALRNQEGGGHLDAHLDDEAYVGVSRENSAGWLFGTPGEGSQPVVPGPHFASMRQIAWEVEQALVNGGLIAPA